MFNRGYFIVDTKKIIASAVQAAHISGVQALSQEQFDALFLSARGMGAMKKKYNDNLLGLQSALMQEDILGLIGIPLNAEYLKQKQALQKKHYVNKDKLSHSEFEQKEEELLIELQALRNQFKIDQFIDERINEMINNQAQYNQKRDGFSKHLCMGFVEEDMDVKVKFAHESDAEFKLKQDINKLLNGDDYNNLRKNYANAKKEIEKQYEQKIKVLEKPISDTLENINAEFTPKIEDARKKIEMLEKYYPKVAVKENNLLKLETVRQEYAITLSKYNSNPTILLKQKLEKLSIERAALARLDNNQAKYKNMTPEARQEALFQEMHSELTGKKQALESERDEKISAIREPIQKELQALKEKRLEELLKLKEDKKYKAELKEADKYFDKKILPLVKELKAQEAQKYFVVLNKKMQDLLADNIQELEQVDSNTIGFVGLLGELMTDLTVLGAVHHIGIKTADEFIKKEAKNVNLSNDGVIQDLLEGAANKVSKKIGKELGQCVANKKIFTQHVEHMEQYAQLQVPKHISEEFEPRRFTEYLPDTSEKTEREQEDNIPDSIFDVIEQFNKSKGFLQKMDTAKSVYQAITSAKPDSHFFNDEPNTAQVFVSALKDEALAFNYQMLDQVSTALETLEKNKVFSNMENGDDWKKILSETKKLKIEKRKLDKEFQDLCKLHQTKRAEYIKADLPYKASKQKLSEAVEKRRVLSGRLEKLIEENDKKKEDLYAKELPKDEREKMTAALEALEEKYDKRAEDNHSWYTNSIKKYEAAHNERLQVAEKEYQKASIQYDKDTEKGVENILRDAYGDAKFSNFKLLASKQDLEKFRKENPEIEGKIAEYKAQRQTRKAKGYPPILAAEKAKSEDQLVSDMTKLVAEYGNKKLSSQKSKSVEKNKILSAQKKIDAKISKLYAEQNNLEAELENLDKDINTAKQEVESSKQVLISISRDFYTAVNTFNEHKTEINEKAQLSLKEVFTLDPEDEPHLRALQSMFKGSYMKVGAIALASEKFLPTIVEGVSTQLMTYDDVANKVLERREVKEVMKTGDEKGVADKAKDNLVQFGAKSIVEGISGQAVKIATAFVDNLDNTVKAEQAFDVDQAAINARAKIRAEEIAKEQGIKVSEIEQNVESTPVVIKEKGLLSSMWRSIKGFFRAIKEGILGGNKTEVDAQLELDSKAEDRSNLVRGEQLSKGNSLSSKPIIPAAEKMSEKHKAGEENTSKDKQLDDAPSRKSQKLN